MPSATASWARVVAEMGRDKQPAAMALVDDRPAHGAAGAGIDLHRRDVPAPEVVEHRRHFGRIGDGAAHVAMDRRIGVEQRAAGEDPRARLGMGRGKAGHERRGHDLVPRAADRRHARRQIQRQHFVAGHVGEVEHMHDMHMGVDQAGQRELAPAIDPHGVGRHFDRFAGRADAGDLLTTNHNRPVRQHLARFGVEDAAVVDHDG